MVVHLIVSALLLDFLGCTMPLALVEDTKAFKVGVFLIWAALVVDSVLMGLFYPRELAGVNPLLAAGLESICLICAMYPLHGFASNLAPCGIRVDTAAALAFIDFLVTAVGYVSLLLGTIAYILLGSQAYGPVDHQAGGFRGVAPTQAAYISRPRSTCTTRISRSSK